MNKDVMFSHKTDEWSTPQDFFDALNDIYNFTLDLCATPENAKCDQFFTKEQDGLKNSWGGGTIWCNPPYSDIASWIRKAKQEAENGAFVVMLIPARTDTRWFHDYLYHNDKCSIEFVKGRLKFSGEKNNAPFPCMIVKLWG